MNLLGDSIKFNRNYGKLTADQEKQLKKIKPVQADNNLHYYRCDITLKNGEVKNKVYFIEAEQFIKEWYLNFKTGYDDIFIPINDVAKIEESRYCLPINIAERIYAGGESTMGGILFVLLFSDGTKQSYLTGNLVDFVQLPEGKKMNEVVDVILHEGKNDPNRIEGFDFYWCLYDK